MRSTRTIDLLNIRTDNVVIDLANCYVGCAEVFAYISIIYCALRYIVSLSLHNFVSVPTRNLTTGTNPDNSSGCILCLGETVSRRQ